MLRLAQEGEKGENGGPPGDLFIQIGVSPHPTFSRKGNDLVCEIPIGFATASTIGPVNMSASSKIAARTTMTSVTNNCTGRSFQIGLPSGVS